jgi:hypothetical protein
VESLRVKIRVLEAELARLESGSPAQNGAVATANPPDVPFGDCLCGATQHPNQLRTVSHVKGKNVCISNYSCRPQPPSHSLFRGSRAGENFIKPLELELSASHLTLRTSSYSRLTLLSRRANNPKTSKKVCYAAGAAIFLRSTAYSSRV